MADTYIPLSPNFRTSRPSDWGEARTFRALHTCAHCGALTYVSSEMHGHRIDLSTGVPRRVGCGGRVLS